MTEYRFLVNYSGRAWVIVEADSIEEANNPSISFKDIISPTNVSNADEKPDESKAAVESTVDISSTADISLTAVSDTQAANSADKTAAISKQQPSYFDDAVKKSVYTKQTAVAEKKEISNCPLCALGHDSNKTKIWKLAEMDADHVTAWSKGGATDIKNCEMLCKTHNRAKGNK